MLLFVEQSSLLFGMSQGRSDEKMQHGRDIGSMLEQNKHQKGSQKVHTIGEQDIALDEYLLKEAQLEMNLEQ